MATIERYCEAYPIVASLAPIRRHTGTENIVIIIIAITPIEAPVQNRMLKYVWPYHAFLRQAFGLS